MNLFSIISNGLRRRKIRTILAIFGITIASASLFSLISLKQGYEQGMRGELQSMGAHIIAVAKGCPYEAVAIMMMGGQVPATLPYEVVDKIKNIPNISVASPNVYGRYEVNDVPHTMVGITEDELKLKPWWIITGDLPLGENEVLLGSNEANSLRNKLEGFEGVGDYVDLNIHGESHTFLVVGILEQTGSKDDYSSFFPIRTVQRFMNLEERVVTINIQVDDVSTIPFTISSIQDLPDVQAVTVAQVMGTLQNLVQTGESMLKMVMLIALVIGGLGTMNTMMMSIFERTKEIGLIKATGASEHQIFTLFFLEGLAISLLGGFLGVAIGLLTSLGGDFILSKFVPVMPTVSITVFSFEAIGIALFFPLLVGSLSAVYPAMKAAMLNPIDAIRNE